MSAEPALMSLVAVATAIAAKKVSSREVTRSCLHRIAEWQPRLNAFMAIEAEAALAPADAADAALAKGNNRGPLHGVPLAHKDMYYDEGKVVTCGSKIRRDYVATTTSTARGIAFGFHETREKSLLQDRHDVSLGQVDRWPEAVMSGRAGREKAAEVALGGL